MMNTLLTTLQAAQYLGLTARTMKVWRCLKKGPPFLRVGGRAVRYDPEAIHHWAQYGGSISSTTVEEVQR